MGTAAPRPGTNELTSATIQAKKVRRGKRQRQRLAPKSLSTKYAESSSADGRGAQPLNLYTHAESSATCRLAKRNECRTQPHAFPTRAKGRLVHMELDSESDRGGGGNPASWSPPQRGGYAVPSPAGLLSFAPSGWKARGHRARRGAGGGRPPPPS